MNTKSETSDAPGDTVVVMEKSFGSGPGADRVVVRTTGGNPTERSPREIVIDAQSGLFSIDGVTYLKSPKLGIGAIVCDLYNGDYAMNDASIVEEAASALGMSTSDIRWLSRADEVTWADIAVMNRFKGYPDIFYEDAMNVRSDTSILFGGPCDLPREYYDLEPLYPLSGLPDDREIRQLALEQPTYLSLALRCPQLPTDDEEKLHRLMSHPSGVSYFEEIASGFGTAFWRYAAHLVGEDELWEWAFNQEPRKLRRYGPKLNIEPWEYHDCDERFSKAAPDLSAEAVLAAATNMMAPM